MRARRARHNGRGPAPIQQRVAYVSSGQLLTVLCVAAATLLAVAVLRRAGIPAPVVLVVAGLIIGFLPFVPDVSLQPEVVLLGLLPLLVFDAAVTASPTAFFRHARSIGVLAVLLVAATAAVVAAIAHWAGHLSWPMAFVLGTAVGPTDVAAATAGLYLGWHSSGGAFSARSRLQSGAFWATLVFLVNAALFVLVGLSFHAFSTQARGPVGRLALTGAAVVAAVIVLRLAWM